MIARVTINCLTNCSSLFEKYIFNSSINSFASSNREINFSHRARSNAFKSWSETDSLYSAIIITQVELVLSVGTQKYLYIFSFCLTSWIFHVLLLIILKRRSWKASLRWVLSTLVRKPLIFSEPIFLVLIPIYYLNRFLDQ